MFQHLPQDRILKLVESFSHLPLIYDGPTRGVLFAGVPGSFTALLTIGLPPRIQLMGDLKAVNELERLSDGSVPLLLWLTNAAALAQGTEEEKIFLKAADDVAHRVSGQPRLDPSKLPETKEAIVHQDDMVPFGFMAAGVSVAAGVAKLRVPRFENEIKIAPPSLYLGTGWLLTSTLLITNHHVINARNEAESPATAADFERQAKAMDVQFDFDGDDQAGTRAKVLALEAFEPALDYALVRVDIAQRSALIIAPTPLTIPQNNYVAVNVVQHPGGDSKRYAIRNNLVTAVSGTDIRYFTDTKGGSSGAPVLNDSWRVVALHRGASYVDNVQFQGRSTAWVNLGTQIHPILADLRNRYPALNAELPN
jgi:endonuclease G